jgi:beta-glucosidase
LDFGLRLKSKTIVIMKKHINIVFAALLISVLLASCAGGKGSEQPVLGTRSVSVIEKNGLQFKDLNKNGELDLYEDWRLTADERAEDLLSRMMLEEKAGLMHISSERRRGGGVPGGGAFPGRAAGAEPVMAAGSEPPRDAVADVPEDPFPVTVDYINNRHLRYLVIRDNIPASALAGRNNKYQELAEQSRLGIPIVFTSNPRNHVSRIEFGIIEASGQFSLWPGQLGLAAAHDSSLIRRFAEIARKEWRASGIRKIYGYQVEVATEPRWRRINGTFGESPDLSAEYTWALVRGFQGPVINKESVVHTIKHFPGDGPVHLGLDPHGEAGQWAVYPTEGSLYKYHLPPFQAAFDAGVSSLMSFYNNPNNALSVPQLKGLPFEEVAGAYNKAIITDLPKEMGFTGYVNTDSGILSGMAWGVQELSMEERYAKAVRAGSALFSDVNDPSPLISAVKKGLLSEEDLNPAVKSLLKEIFALGLFEDPYVDPDLAREVSEDPESQAIAYEAHKKSIVLLRNSGTLPLSNNKKVYIEAFSGNTSETATRSFKELVRKSVTVVDRQSEADVAYVWVMPSTYEISAEEGVSINLDKNTGIDVKRIKEIESALPTVLIIDFSNPWIIKEIEPGAAAVLATFGVKGEALLDVIYGRFNPTGKLPFTIPKDQEAVKKNASDVPGYAEDFDYVYTDKNGNDYTFGFGISY